MYSITKISIVAMVLLVSSGHLISEEPRPDHVVPPDLIYIDNVLSKQRVGSPTENLVGYIKKYYFTKSICITWKYRPSSDYEFKFQDQKLEASYNILGVWAPNKNNVYIAGVSETGDTVIERWRLAHPAIILKQPKDGGEMIWYRGMPRVQRSELYRGPELTHVCDIYGDPQGRNILLYTWEERCIYRMDIATGEYTLLFGPHIFPGLQNFRSIYSLENEYGVYVYYLGKTMRGRSSKTGKTPITIGPRTYFLTDTIYFVDSDKDGLIETDSIEAMTAQEWADFFYSE